MRITINVDDNLLRAAQEATGLKTKKAVVEKGLKLLVRLGHQTAAAKALWGAADWEGDLRALREDRELPGWQ